jgi:hypothetical protein
VGTDRLALAGRGPHASGAVRHVPAPRRRARFVAVEFDVAREIRHQRKLCEGDTDQHGDGEWGEHGVR